LDGTTTDLGTVWLLADSSELEVFWGVNVSRRSVHGQPEHLNERYSYPCALITFAGTTCSNRIVAPHAIQRMEDTLLET
jgi:hypothetical protein